MAMTAISGFVGRRMAFSNCFGRLCIGRKVFFFTKLHSKVSVLQICFGSLKKRFDHKQRATFRVTFLSASMKIDM